MIAHLSGFLITKEKKFIILNVNKVGYKIFVSEKTLAKLDLQDEVSLFCDLNIKDELIHLYGFLDQSEQNAFRLLTSVQGVGAKAALSILSSLSVDEFVTAILSEDKKTMTISEGIGPKIASRIVNELSSKVETISSSLDEFKKFSAKQTDGKLNQNNDSLVNDAVSALTNLGYNRSDAFLVVNQMIFDNKTLGLSEIISLSLQRLGQKK